MAKTIEQLAKEYAEWCYPYDEEMRFQCEQHFEAGAEAEKMNLFSELPPVPVKVLEEYADCGGITIESVLASLLKQTVFFRKSCK